MGDRGGSPVPESRNRPARRSGLNGDSMDRNLQDGAGSGTSGDSRRDICSLRQSPVSVLSALMGTAWTSLSPLGAVRLSRCPRAGRACPRNGGSKIGVTCSYLLTGRGQQMHSIPSLSFRVREMGWNRDRARSYVFRGFSMTGESLCGRRQVRARCRSVRFDLSDAEYAEVAAAARNAGLARGAFAAKATLAAARSTAGPTVAGDMRETLAELMRAGTLVQRIGVNLNQAVAKLNATGEPSGSLVPIAEHCSR